MLVYIRDNKDLVLKYYSDIKDAPLSDLFIQANIKTKNHLMFSLALFGNIVQTLEEVQENI